MACNVACAPSRSDDEVRCAATAAEFGVNEATRLRVLCLHSFRTNAKILEVQLMLRGWLKKLKDRVEFVYLDAPYACTGDEAARQDAAVREYFPADQYGAYREWWNASQSGEYARLDATLKHVDEFVEREGPFDGLLGFSQGAALACALANLGERGAFPHRFGFVVALSPPPPRDPRLKIEACATKALFCVHERDPVVPAAATQKLYETFENATWVTCKGADHAPPKFNDGLAVVAAFFADLVQAPPVPLPRQATDPASPTSPKVTLNIEGASHVIKSKNGGLVRAGADLGSAEVALLPTLQPVRVVEHRLLPTRPDGKVGIERCRVVEPLNG